MLKRLGTELCGCPQPVAYASGSGRVSFRRTGGCRACWAGNSFRKVLKTLVTVSGALRGCNDLAAPKPTAKSGRVSSRKVLNLLALPRIGRLGGFRFAKLASIWRQRFWPLIRKRKKDRSAAVLWDCINTGKGREYTSSYRLDISMRLCRNAREILGSWPIAHAEHRRFALVPTASKY